MNIPHAAHDCSPAGRAGPPSRNGPARNAARWLTAAALALGCAGAMAQSGAYPSHPVRMVLPYSVGSGPDAVARMLGEQLTAAWKQPVIVENKPGANGWLAIGDVKRGGQDGYSLAIVDNTHMTLQPHLYRSLPFDPVRDFEPAAPIYHTHFFVVVSADSPWKNVGDLVAAARAQPDRLTYGTWGMGGVAHVGTTMFQDATGTRMTHVPFRTCPSSTPPSPRARSIGPSARRRRCRTCTRPSGSSCWRWPRRRGCPRTRTCRRWPRPAGRKTSS